MFCTTRGNSTTRIRHCTRMPQILVSHPQDLYRFLVACGHNPVGTSGCVHSETSKDVEVAGRRREALSQSVVLGVLWHDTVAKPVSLHWFAGNGR